MLLLLAAIGIVASMEIARAEPILRARVVETLSIRFKSKVELDAFHVSLWKGFQVSGGGLKIFGDMDPNRQQPGIQPLIAVDHFRFRMGIGSLFRTPAQVDTVYVRGLRLNLPPREQRGQMRDFGATGGKVKILVDKLVCEDTLLVINTMRPGKLPLEFDIQNLNMWSVGPNSPMRFEAGLTNPKPVGEIFSRGTFGPWQADSPRDTPVSGAYTFSHADLGTIKGIGGILSSTGRYSGTLDNIVVDGTTDTPDFRIATAERPVQLHTEFHAIVDGTKGDTTLQPVRAKIVDSWLVANGSVVRMKDPDGHRVELDVTMDKGNIQDLLKLAVRTDPPVMTGTVQLRTKLDLPPGDPDVSQRLRLVGEFRVSDAHFTNEKIQIKVDEISLRGQGKPRLAQDTIPDNIHSAMGGRFNLAAGKLNFPRLDFRVPGTRVYLTGRYSLDGNQFDFLGTARMEAKLSHMVTGWKSLLLKPVDPFFSKHGAGTEVKFTITGTKSDLRFRPSFGHKDRSKDDSRKD